MGLAGPRACERGWLQHGWLQRQPTQRGWVWREPEPASADGCDIGLPEGPPASRGPDRLARSPVAERNAMTEPTAAPTPLAPPEVSALTLTAPEPPQAVAATQAPAMAPQVDPATVPALDEKV